MNSGFLLVTWCNGKEVAISIGRRHEQWFPIGYWFLLVAGMNCGFLLVTWCDGKEVTIFIGRRHELIFPIGYLMWREGSRVFLLVAGINCGFLLATWCARKESRDFYWSQAWIAISYWLPDVTGGKPRFSIGRSSCLWLEVRSTSKILEVLGWITEK